MTRPCPVLILIFALVLAACGAVRGTVWAAEADVSVDGPDSIWRSIFARPAAEPLSDQDVKQRNLGAALFLDKRLSKDGDRACASCHQPERGYSDGLATALGRDGSALKRNTPHLYNLKDATSFYWDGREPTLEAQARVPLHATNELAANSAELLERLSADREVMRKYAEAFPGQQGLSETDLLRALAAYEKTLVSPLTAFDAWIDGNDQALDEREKRGFRLFVGKGGCVSCHGGWRMTDDGFHDIGLKSDDPGRSTVAGGAAGIAAFKTPGLRQVSRTAPYMHDGSLATLDDVVAHYAGKHANRPSLAPSLVRDLQLSAEERAALVAFLNTL
jgi:cytochrome c peroxidase